jgi:hypothetical protein
MPQQVEILAVLGLDADQHRAEIARRLLQILKPRDIVLGARAGRGRRAERLAVCGSGRRNTSSVPRSAATAPSRPAKRSKSKLPPETTHTTVLPFSSLREKSFCVSIASAPAGSRTHALDVEHFEDGRARALFSGTSFTASAGKSFRYFSGSRPISATAAPVDEMSTVSSFRPPAMRQRLAQAGRAAGSVKTKRARRPARIAKIARSAPPKARRRPPG